MTTQYATIPKLVQQSALETIAWSVDISALGVPTTPSTILLDLATGKPVTLPDAPTINGNLISQIIDGSVLDAGSSYRLTFIYTVGGNILVSEVTLQCPGASA